MAFHWSLSYSKSPRVSRTLLSILVDFTNSLVWMVFTNPIISNFSICSMLTSDPAELSDEKFTSVNNRCIRSKISGDNLNCRQVQLSANCDATGSRWMSNNYITRVRQEVNQLERRCWNENHVPAEAGPLGLRLSSLRERERNAVIARRVGGGQYVAVLFSLRLTSHT